MIYVSCFYTLKCTCAQFKLRSELTVETKAFLPYCCHTFAENLKTTEVRKRKTISRTISYTVINKAVLC